jgi:hypothetical protein
MDFSPGVGIPNFTRLHARISQEEIGFTVKVHMHNHLKSNEACFGTEIADSIEMASGMIGMLAVQFSIPQQGISINIVMSNFRDGTVH